MIDSEIKMNELGNNVPGPTAVHKQQPVLAAKKVALRDLQNNNSNLTRNSQYESLTPDYGQRFADASKTCGTKRLTPDYTSSPILSNNDTHEHFNHPRRKYEASQINGKNVHYGSLPGPNQLSSKNYLSRFVLSDDEKRLDRFLRLQNFIKQCDGSDHRENIQLLLRLSPLELSKHAVELEKRAIQLTIEEGKEMQRMQALNILGKPSVTRNPIPMTQHIQHKN